VAASRVKPKDEIPEQDKSEALVEVFWRAFQGLTREQRALFLEKWLSADPQLAEDLGDIWVAYSRRSEPTRPLEEVLKDLRRIQWPNRTSIGRQLKRTSTG